MEDRWSKLAVQAQIDGSLDFANSHRCDTRWLLKERVILDAIEDRIRVDITKLAHEWHCSVASKATLDGNDDDFEFHKKEATETFNLIGKLCLSWYKGWEGERDKLVEIPTATPWS